MFEVETRLYPSRQKIERKRGTNVLDLCCTQYHLSRAESAVAVLSWRCDAPCDQPLRHLVH